MAEFIQPYHVYEYSYPESMPDVGGIVFYVGKAKNVNRMDDHLREANSGQSGRKCDAIRAIWAAGLVPVRRIVFESPSEIEALTEEARRILLHDSPYLTNIIGAMNQAKAAEVRVAEKKDSSLIVDLVPCETGPSKRRPFVPSFFIINVVLKLEEMRYLEYIRLRETPKEMPELVDGGTSVIYMHPARFVHGKLVYGPDYYERCIELERQGRDQLIPLYIKHKKYPNEHHGFCFACEAIPFVPIRSIDNRKRRVTTKFVSEPIGGDRRPPSPLWFT